MSTLLLVFACASTNAFAASCEPGESGLEVENIKACTSASMNNAQEVSSFSTCPPVAEYFIACAGLNTPKYTNPNFMNFAAPSGASYVLLGAALYTLHKHDRVSGMKYFRAGSRITRALMEAPDYKAAVEQTNNSNYGEAGVPLSILLNRVQAQADRTQ